MPWEVGQSGAAGGNSHMSQHSGDAQLGAQSPWRVGAAACVRELRDLLARRRATQLT